MAPSTLATPRMWCAGWQHNIGKGARYTLGRRPVTLLAAWAYPSRGEALHAERAMKRLKRAQKLQLVAASQAGEAGGKETLPGTTLQGWQTSLENPPPSLS
jgi:predicted GIY-YIG superfamily endonuclease